MSEYIQGVKLHTGSESTLFKDYIHGICNTGFVEDLQFSNLNLILNLEANFVIKLLFFDWNFFFWEPVLWKAEYELLFFHLRFP